MVKLRPFRATYLNPHALKSPGKSLRAAHRFMAQSVSEPAHMTQNIQQWLTEGRLEETPEAGYYLHTHDFVYQDKAFQRSDLFVHCKIEPLQSGSILPHEHTLTGPADRLYQYLAQSGSHLSPVCCLYTDPDNELQSVFRKIRSQKSLLAYQTEPNDCHTVHACTEPELIFNLNQFFARQKLYIADGHHRYETAELFGRDHGHKISAANFILMYLTSLQDPGLLVLPFHRLIRGPFIWPEWSQFMDRLKNYFEMQEIRSTDIQAYLINTEPTKMQLVMQKENTCWLLQRDKGLPQTLKPNVDPAFSDLDLSVLHELILKQLALFPHEYARNPHYIYFSHKISEIQSELKKTGGVAFYLNNPPVQTLCDVADARQNMPPKSTYFYPKVPNGLLLTRFNTAF